ncbi:MAG: host attachment protein [Chthoniobacterales bacterium]
MIPSTLVVVVDRGSLKAYKVNETPNRGASLQLVQAFNIMDAHGRYQDKVSDQAGGFPDAAGPGGMNSIAERHGIENETDRRLHRELANKIAETVKREAAEGWSFAAPARIHAAITELLPNEVRDRIVEHVSSDLVNIEPAKLPSHFRSLQSV